MTSEELNIIFLSLKVAAISTLLTLPLAVFFAWIMARKQFPGKPLLESMIAIPLVAPPVVTGYFLLLILGRNGLLGSLMYSHLGISLSFNFSSLVIAAVVVALPLSVRTIRSAFELVNPDYERASRTLGASPLNTFTRISLPLALPGIISGSVLAFARSLGEFGATITFAGNISGETQTIPLKIYSSMQVPGSENEVTRLVIISVLISMIAIITAEYFNKKKKYLIS